MRNPVLVTSNYTITRDGLDIDVEISAEYRKGRKSCYGTRTTELGYPGEPGDIKILEVVDEKGEDYILTDREEQDILLQITDENE